MKKNKKTLLALLAMIFTCGTHYAQDTGFDLSTQRSESQESLKVPGSVVDHNGLIINPTPQSLNVVDGKFLNISKGISLRDKQNAFGNDLSFLNVTKKGTPLTIEFGKAVANKYGVKDISGAYSTEKSLNFQHILQQHIILALLHAYLSIPSSVCPNNLCVSSLCGVHSWGC